ncbi:nucleotidyltransferase-like protein [Paenibacillus sp. KQZ6P-2]|uniref:Nucleotidyltransferase-like protein n=1 Tax=Paenibacillus mangrovi TaxID=2931978 RepID=A0A9X1WTM8_9BACL|nr:nucleotidyltransferase-like protein [Paenibacillus mangrovi]MCJ8014471.1 nucleotidyltransferase-like protein [Paenibacillus mangrovi]
MDLSNLSFFYGESVDVDAVGTIIYRQEAHKFDGSLLHDFDFIVLIVHEEQAAELAVEHTLIGDLPCQVLHVTIESLQRWLIAGEKGDLIRCFMEGELVHDQEGRLAMLRQEYIEFEQPLRDRKMLYEFSRFLSIYVEAKRYMQAGYVIDAYQCVLDSLKHWARIELIERGVLPDKAVWEQVKELNTAIHKLYEELTQSTETIQQRVELVLLACEFSVMSKMAECSVHLLQILRGRSKPWSIEELIHHPDLKMVRNELPLVMRKLVNRSLVKEFAVWTEFSGYGSQGIRYSAD